MQGVKRVRTGITNHPLYGTWSSMLKRCRNPKHKAYHRYGGRGITVCDRWLNFQNFICDIGERPVGLTLDRIDNDLGYSPENCRWATRMEQVHNRSEVGKWEFRGKKRTVKAIAKLVGMNFHTLRHRLENGGSLDAALTKAPKKTGPSGKKYLFQGKELTVRELSEITGISRGILGVRLSRGVPIDLAIKPMPKSQLYLFKGQMVTLSEVSRAVGIGRVTLLYRLKIGMSLNEAINHCRYGRAV